MELHAIYAPIIFPDFYPHSHSVQQFVISSIGYNTSLRDGRKSTNILSCFVSRNESKQKKKHKGGVPMYFVSNPWPLEPNILSKDK